MTALAASEQTGGDVRGLQSAALLVLRALTGIAGRRRRGGSVVLQPIPRRCRVGTSESQDDKPVGARLSRHRVRRAAIKIELSATARPAALARHPGHEATVRSILAPQTPPVPAAAPGERAVPVRAPLSQEAFGRSCGQISDVASRGSGRVKCQSTTCRGARWGVRQGHSARRVLMIRPESRSFLAQGRCVPRAIGPVPDLVAAAIIC